MRLWVCCGHGAGDSGAVGNGYTEAERVRALGTRIKELGGDGVVLMDQSRNWYADHGFDSVSIPAGDAVAELHMDSAAASARGGHVIYRAGFAPDAYDRALAEGVSKMFPGRAKPLVGRADLRNCNVCSRRGINYRLVENGFISNASDVRTFNSRLDELARLYLNAFGIAPGGEGAGEETTTDDSEDEMTECLIDVPKCDECPTGATIYYVAGTLHDIDTPDATEVVRKLYRTAHGGREIPVVQLSATKAVPELQRLVGVVRGGIPAERVIDGIDRFAVRSEERADGNRGVE